MLLGSCKCCKADKQVRRISVDEYVDKMKGGRGSVISSFFGVLIIAVLGAGLAQIGAQESTKRLITGCVIIAAVIIDQYRHRIRKSNRHVTL